MGTYASACFGYGIQISRYMDNACQVENPLYDIVNSNCYKFEKEGITIEWGSIQVEPSLDVILYITESFHRTTGACLKMNLPHKFNDWDDKLMEICNKFNIPYVQPSWILTANVS